MRMLIVPMSQRDAEEITSWRYEGAYAFYNPGSATNDLTELLDPALRGEHACSVREDFSDDLIGFFVCRNLDSDVELGLGLRPDLTGRGFGESFVREGLHHIRQRYPEADVTLGVAEFNERAVRLYRRIGFVTERRVLQESGGAVHPFVRMRLRMDQPL